MKKRCVYWSDRLERAVRRAAELEGWDYTDWARWVLADVASQVLGEDCHAREIDPVVMKMLRARKGSTRWKAARSKILDRIYKRKYAQEKLTRVDPLVLEAQQRDRQLELRPKADGLVVLVDHATGGLVTELGRVVDNEWEPWSQRRREWWVRARLREMQESGAEIPEIFSEFLEDRD